VSEAPVPPAGPAPRPLPPEVYRRALRVGRGAAGRSGPNPPVGCVILHDGLVLAEGATAPAGGAHAEVVALEAAGARAEGAVLVVTLEPCAHHGRTPPCTEAIVRAGVREVHVLHRDPDPVATGGIARLRAAGIAVLEVEGALPEVAAEAAHDLRGFLARVRHDRPHVHLKLAQDVAGRTTPVGVRYLTGAAARRRVHAIRADVDAVLVGGGTVRADDPQLDVRDVVSDVQPRAVVLSTTADVPVDAAVVRPGTIVICADAAPADRDAALDAHGAEVVRVPGTTGGLDVAAALHALLEHRVLTVLAEPGPRLAEVLLADDLVDVIELHVAGGAEVPVERIRPACPGLAPLLAGGHAVERSVTEDGDLLLRADVVRRTDAGSHGTSEPRAFAAVR